MERSMRLLVLCLLVPAAASAYGEGTVDRPSLEERAVHLFTDRLRVEPDATDPQFSNYAPVRPLRYHPDLNDAARFYADDMAENGCFPADHSSCDGTPFGDRLRQFYSGGAIGENIAYGSPDPATVVFDGWLYSAGHRENMLRDGWDELGTGFARGDSLLWVQDFGTGGGSEEPIITSSTPWPMRPSADGSVTVYAAVYAPAGAPGDVVLHLDGESWTMQLDRGEPGMGTYSVDVDAGPAGCVPYWFEAVVDGESVPYPTTGSLLMPVGASACELWVAERDGQASGTPNGPGLAGTGSGCGDPGGVDNASTDDVEYSSCHVAARPGSSLLMVLALLGARRRR